MSLLKTITKLVLGYNVPFEHEMGINILNNTLGENLHPMNIVNKTEKCCLSWFLKKSTCTYADLKCSKLLCVSG